ncbi:MAG: hypothetical protein AAF215_22020 [Cyanobacteria bacterium P01_A01_bin.123]
MTQLYYRGMAGRHGKPRVGRSARLFSRTTMLLERYEAAIAATQNDWEKVDQDGLGI